MKKPRAKRPLQDIVRETFTPSRVGLLSWAFAAVVMGTIGLASYQFASPAATFRFSGQTSGGMALPAAGTVETTASTRSSGSYPVGIIQVPRTVAETQAARDNQEQIEVLQREIVGLRRRLSALTEQNVAYSRRIAALEQEVSTTRLAAVEKQLAAGVQDQGKVIEPAPGVVSFEALPAELPVSGKQKHKPVAAIPHPKKPKKTDNEADALTVAGVEPPAVPAKKTPAAVTSSNVPARIISIYNERNAPQASSLPSSIDTAEPVRIVNLPDPTDAPVVTGSIPPQSPEATAEAFDATPTRTAPKPSIVTSSDPSGRLTGGGKNKLKRSDFGAVIGRYPSAADATIAWAGFKEQNQERLGDLHPLILDREVAEGGVSLMVGPFANAADAAVACLQLLDVTEFCHPALFAGEPLVTAADFPDSAL